MDYSIKKSNLIFFAVLTITVLYILLHSEFNSIVLELKKVNPIWFSMAFLCILIYWMIEAKTLHIMLTVYDKNFNYLQILKLVISSQFFNGVTPFATGGQPFQIYILNKHSDLGIGSVTSASVLNFIMYQTVLVIMGVTAFLIEKTFLLFPNNPPNVQLLAFTGFSLNFLIIISLIIIAISNTLTEKMLSVVYKVINLSPFKKNLPKIQKKLKAEVIEFHTDISILISNKNIYVKSLLLNILKLLSFYTVAYFICKSLGFTGITVLQSIIASAYVMLITSVVPLPGGSGGAEIGFLVFFSSFIVGPQATAIMLLWRFITYYVGLIAGLLTFYFGYQSE